MGHRDGEDVPTTMATTAFTDELGAHERDVDAIVGRAEEVPARAEGIGGERDDALAGEQQ